MKAHPQHKKDEVISLIQGGATVVDAAKAVGVSPSTASNWAREKRGIRHAHLAGKKVPSYNEWPEDYHEACRGLPVYARQAFGRFLAFLDGDEVTRDAVRLFTQARRNYIKPESLGSELIGLGRALAVVSPEVDWSFLTIEGSNIRKPTKEAEEKTSDNRGRRRTLSVALHEWPAEHLARWDRTKRRGRFYPDVLKHKRRKAKQKQISATTFKNMEKSYSMYLHFVRDEGLGDEISPEALQEFIDACRARDISERSVASYVEGIYLVAPVLEPHGDYEWLWLTSSSLSEAAKTAPKQKWSKRLVDPTEVWVLGEAFVRAARESVPNRVQTATQYRNGVILMMLSSMALRMRNISGARVGDNLIMGNGVKTRLEFGPSEMKNKNRAEFEVWGELEHVLEEYLSQYRPLLANGTYQGDELWLVSSGRGALSRAGIYKVVTELTETYLGVRINPHLIRDCVASKLIDVYPDTPEYASKMLQHRNPKSLGEYTEMAGTISASRKLGGVIGAFDS